jgi:hypothetical protein
MKTLQIMNVEMMLNEFEDERVEEADHFISQQITIFNKFWPTDTIDKFKNIILFKNGNKESKNQLVKVLKEELQRMKQAQDSK